MPSVDDLELREHSDADADRFVELCERLRKMGATKVSAHGYAAEFGPEPRALAKPAPIDLTEEVQLSTEHMRQSAVQRVRAHPVGIVEGLDGLPANYRAALTDDDVQALLELEYVPGARG